MRHRTLDEMVSYFNQQVSEMDIDHSCKIQLLGMVSAIAYGVQNPQWIPCSERLPIARQSVILSTKEWTGEGCYWETLVEWGDGMVVVLIVFALLIIGNAVKIEKLEERIRRLERR